MDERGTILTTMHKNFFAASPLAAKAPSLREALVLGGNLTLASVIIDSNNQILVDLCRGNNNREELREIIDDIKLLSSNFVNCGFTWVSRDGSIVAHSIAALA